MARLMKVSRGTSMPRVLYIRSWTSLTALKEMETAISVSTSAMGSGASATAAFVAGLVLGGAGGAILMLLRSRCSSFEIRAVCSEG